MLRQLPIVIFLTDLDEDDEELRKFHVDLDETFEGNLEIGIQCLYNIKFT